MGTEIERKFLVDSDSWRTEVTASHRISQGYIAVNDEASVRVRISGDQAWLNVKSSGLEITRSEFEYVVPVTDAEQMLAQFCSGQRLSKTRHIVLHAGRRWEVDEFEGDNRGLILAEAELETEDEVLELPGWVGDEVSSDPRYFNNNLSVTPYRSWPEQEP